jgi:hypothetical protein
MMSSSPALQVKSMDEAIETIGRARFGGDVEI